MPRQYPRFLFSNPENTKSKGPFIIHTLHPRMIMRYFDNRLEDLYSSGTCYTENNHSIVTLDIWDQDETGKENTVLKNAMEWYLESKP